MVHSGLISKEGLGVDDPVQIQGSRLRGKLEASGQQQPRTGNTDFTTLFGITRPDQVDFGKLWQTTRDRRPAGLPIGVTETGSPVELNIAAVERSWAGWYGQGLVVGDEDPGRAELLRAIVLGMTLRHSPEEVGFVLVDVYGRGTFDGFERLPHLSALVSGISHDRYLLDRLFAALSGECDRRLSMLRAMGNFRDMGDWDRARAAGDDLDPVPALVVVIDDLAGIGPEQRQTLEFCANFARLGKVIRTHMLLGLAGHESAIPHGPTAYRIVLDSGSGGRQRSAPIENTSVQPTHPRRGYLHAGPESIRFEAVRLSGMIPMTTSSGAIVLRTLPDVLVSQMYWHGPPVHEVWLPPLDSAPTLDQFIPNPIAKSTSHPTDRLSIAIGIIDRPFDQRRDLLRLDLADAQSNVAIVGAPESGKSTTLRTLIMALSLKNTPNQVQFYCLDFGGGSLASLSGLPHVGSVVTNGSAGIQEEAQRVVAELTALVEARARYFREVGIRSIDQLRAFDQDRHSGAATPCQDPLVDAFLVVDGLDVIDQDFPMLRLPITELAAQGPSHGVHVVVTAADWFRIPPHLQPELGRHIELRLGDPSRSKSAAELAARVPGRPGRGITPEGYHLLTALPRLDGNPDPGSLEAAVAQAVSQVQRMSGRTVPPGDR